MSAAALLRDNPDPDDAAIDAAMSGNLCRCGTYPRIRRAIHRAAGLARAVGVFDPAEENKWEEHGQRILSMMLDNTGMLLCAEELGMIPKACPTTLKEFGIPGNEVQRWVKDWSKRHDFLPPDEYRQISVSMLSPHDTTNWSAWWENEAAGRRGAFYQDITRARDRL